MKNIRELQKALCEVFTDIKSGKLKPVVAVEMNNAAGKIISASKLELEYQKSRGEKPEIPFLN